MPLYLLILQVNLVFRNSLFFLQVNIMAAAISLSGITTLEQQAYVVALELQKLELAIPAETRPNNVQIAFDTEASTVAISINLGTALTVSAGSAHIAAVTYLS
jgi:hypothetical protein